MSVFSQLVASNDSSIILTVPNGKVWKIQALHINAGESPPVEVFLFLDPDSTGPNSEVYRQDFSNIDTNFIAAAIAGTPGLVGGTAVFSLPDCWMPAGSEIRLSKIGTGTWNATFVIQD